MNRAIATYLQDHLAGAAFAIDLLKALRDHNSGEALGEFASGLLVEIEHDRNALQRIADRVGKGSSDLKQAAAWLAEKVSRFKLSHDDPTKFGTFQALETLALGILGKRALWQALQEISVADDRVSGENLRELIGRAEQQYSQIEDRRLLAARRALQRSS
jgi:hypothetical protein